MKILSKANSTPAKSKSKSSDLMDVDTIEEEDVKIVQLSDDLLTVGQYNIKGQTVDEQLDNLIYQLFKNYGVLKLTYIMSLINIRQRSALSSNKIRDNVTQSMIRAKLNEHCVSIRKNVYVLKTSGDEQVDLYRQLLIKYFEKNQSIQKSVFNKLVSAASLSKIPTGIYNKILKELATSHGATWTLKSGIPDEVLE